MSNKPQDEFTKYLVGRIMHELNVEKTFHPKDTQHIIELTSRTIIVMLQNISKIQDDRIAKDGY